jgi:geranylgeranyl pyrophosphate synthase
MKIGIAFQVADDIQDALPKEKKSSDQTKNKATAVSLLGYAQAERYRETLLEESLCLLRSLSREAHLLTSLFHKSVTSN